MYKKRRTSRFTFSVLRRGCLNGSHLTVSGARPPVAGQLRADAPSIAALSCAQHLPAEGVADRCRPAQAAGGAADIARSIPGQRRRACSAERAGGRPLALALVETMGHRGTAQRRCQWVSGDAPRSMAVPARNQVGVAGLAGGNQVAGPRPCLLLRRARIASVTGRMNRRELFEAVGNQDQTPFRRAAA